MTSSTYTIGQAARAAGVGVETVRFYERKGLIEQPPTPAYGARRYAQDTVDRIRALRQGQDLGFSLTELDELLALKSDPSADCSDVRERAEAHLDEVERKRARLGDVADKLRELIAACPGQGATRECTILETFTSPDYEASGQGHAAAGCGSRVELAVTGMACGGCASTVRTTLENAAGVYEAAVDRVTGIARVRIDPDVTNTDALAEALTEAGFPAAAH